MPDEANYRRSFHGGVEHLTAIAEFTREAVSKLGAEEHDRLACELAVDEAATNAFKHGYLGNPGRVDITIWREGDTIVMEVRNWGRPFDPVSVPEPDLSVPIEERPLGGLGLFLIRRMMSDVSFTFNPEAGNTITMRRRIGQPLIADQRG